MDNIVSLGLDRPRPRRAFGVPRDGAQILFFTGVRYCRDDESLPSDVPAPHVIRDHQHRATESGFALDLAAH